MERRVTPRWWSVIEAVASAASGFVVSWLLTWWALPFWGFQPTAGQSAGIVLMFFVASVLRGFVIREVFRLWRS